MKIKKKSIDEIICLGIDASLNGSAFVLMKNFKVIDYFFFTNVIKNSNSKHGILNKDTDTKRLNNIYEWLNEFLKEYKIDNAVIENYAFGAKSNAVFQIGGLGELIRLCLFRHGVPFKEYTPPSIKKYATGKGNAEKSEMVLAAFKDGFDVSTYGKNGEDLADAYFIAKMLNDEMYIHKNIDHLEKLNTRKKEVFLQVSKSNIIPLIEQSFVSKRR